LLAPIEGFDMVPCRHARLSESARRYRTWCSPSFSSPANFSHPI